MEKKKVKAQEEVKPPFPQSSRLHRIPTTRGSPHLPGGGWASAQNSQSLMCGLVPGT